MLACVAKVIIEQLQVTFKFSLSNYRVVEVEFGLMKFFYDLFVSSSS